MSGPINTIPIQQFIQQVRAAELSQQKEIKLDMKSAKMLSFCLAELSSKMLQDYDELIKKLESGTGQSITVTMDGGSLSKF